MKINIIFLIFYLAMCKSTSSQKIELPQKIFVYRSYDSKIYYLGEKLECHLNNFQRILGWLKQEDLLLMLDQPIDDKGNFLSSNILLRNIKNEIIDSLYSPNVEKGEYISSVLMSPDDKYLYVKIGFNNKIDSITRDLIRIFDISLKKTVGEMTGWGDNNEIHTNFDYYFSPDGRYLLYSIYDGIYMLDVETKERTKLVNGGSDAIWSPAGNLIAYIHDTDRVYIYSLIDETNKLFYTPPQNERLDQIYWTPDGKYLFVATVRLKGLIKAGQKTMMLINIQDKSVHYSDELYDKLGSIFWWKN